ncbi:MAG: ATP-binding protein, partial [Pseudomonadota bacterium]
IPVIMQTAKASKHDILEGLQAGAYYYLTKPFERTQLLAIVQTAVNDHQRLTSLQTAVAQTNKTLSMMHKGEFKFRTLQEGRDLVSLLANASLEPTRVAIGLSELMINAVEHGNLGISYEEKSRYNAHDNWAYEVERRLSLPENAEKDVILSFERNDRELRFLIRDQGNGFDWQQYIEMSPERAFDTHGRGIAMAKAISFDQLEYRGKGNEVEAKLFLQKVDRAQGKLTPVPPRPQ